MASTLGERLSARDAACFAGRSRELELLQALLSEDPPVSVVLLHGPGGVGKSALMRELARRAQATGWTPLPLDARDLTPVAQALEEALTPALELPRPLVLLDSWERMAALDAHLRTELLPRLPTNTLVVLASRRPPAGSWFSGGWEHLALELRLGPLRASEAEALLARRGIANPDERAAAVGWARGSPLALALAAEAGGVPADVPEEDAPPGVVDRLLPLLLDAQPEGEQRSVLAVAALAHVTTSELLAAALPGLDAERAFAWLREHPSAEPLRDGVALHDLVGRVLRADLRRRSPELERDLRRRLVDALYERAIRGGFVQFTRELQHLVRDPAIRWGFAWDASGRYRTDSPRPGDLSAIAAHSGPAGLEWLESAERYFVQAPERVIVVRDREDEPTGYGIAVTPTNAPEFAAKDPLLGPRIAHASEHLSSRAAVICRQAVDLSRERSSPVIALIGMAAMIGSGLENPVGAYLPIARGDAAAQMFSAAVGAVPVAELAIEYAGVLVECHVLDYGAAGVLAHQRMTVYRELGLPPPGEPYSPSPTLEQVRDALRHYRSPGQLALSPLATPDGTVAVRAQVLRTRLDEAVSNAFGPCKEDQRLHQVLVRGYIDPAPTHELAAAELNLSRTAYFRSLRTAVERVAASL